MTTTLPDPPVAPSSPELHRRVTLALQATIALGLALELYERQWLNAAIVAAILLLTALLRWLPAGPGSSSRPNFELLGDCFCSAIERWIRTFIDRNPRLFPPPQPAENPADSNAGADRRPD